MERDSAEEDRRQRRWNLSVRKANPGLGVTGWRGENLLAGGFEMKVTVEMTSEEFREFLDWKDDREFYVKELREFFGKEASYD